MKILIVEDEAIVAMSLQFLLELSDHKIIAITPDLEESIAALDQEMPDLAFVDIKLARGCSGLDVAETLGRRGVPCFFVTGNRPAETRPGLALGCIEKPYSEETLEAALQIAEAHRSGTPLPRDIPKDLILY